MRCWVKSLINTKRLLIMVDSLSSLMEPIIMSVWGVLVGGQMIAMYLPIFMLGSVI